MAEFVRVAGVDEIPMGEGIAVQVEDREIALLNVDGVICAIDNVCPHMGGPLVEGLLKGEILSCPWHAWTFNVRSGHCTFSEDVSVETFQVRVNGSDVEVLIAVD